jgi:putative transposase
VSEAFADCLPGRRSGLSRQAFYQRDTHAQRAVSQSMLVVDLVLALRREIPGLGTRKLHLLLGGPLARSGIKLGRDKLHKILQDHALILRQRRQIPKTTDSTHRLYKYPNLLVEKTIDVLRRAWVCDITYLFMGLGFSYLSLITDAYSN